MPTVVGGVRVDRALCGMAGRARRDCAGGCCRGCDRGALASTTRVSGNTVSPASSTMRNGLRRRSAVPTAFTKAECPRERSFPYAC